MTTPATPTRPVGSVHLNGFWLAYPYQSGANFPFMPPANAKGSSSMYLAIAGRYHLAPLQYGPESPMAPSSRSSYCPGSRKLVTTVRPLAGSGAVVSTISTYARRFDDQTTAPAFEVSARGCPRWST